ncbi:MAG TPA: hypothetical protein PKH24_10380 [Sedimentisphaerales bacterium]|nr:hypothetical protein [Sedimentisphaerales bacterium]HNU29534.1 hypothetical protein [Sedimentisphaerales bacterium]
MTRLPWLSLTVLGILAAFPDPAQGCRYNVREIGFIDTGVEPYRLFVYVPQTVPAGEIGGLKSVLDVACADTNIRCEPVRAGQDANHPALRFLSVHGIDSYPAAVVVSPDGPSRQVPLRADGRSLTEAASSSLEVVLDSPIRRQILEKAADSYAVVLLIEGPQQDRNAVAREAVSAAISRVREQLEFLPKPISRGPEMVVLDRSSLAREEMLLWTLGLEPEDVNEPCAAIFYGRGRWIGPLFKGELLTDANLLRVLPIIGADCECGLDHRWLQGTMLPARWDGSLQQKVASSLGFDPESPMVKMEMVSIIRRGVSGLGDPGVPFGYQEIRVGGEQTGASYLSVSESNNTTSQPGTESVAPPAPQAVAGQVDVDQPRMGGGVLAVSLGGMVVLVAAVSAAILLRAKRN